MLKMQRRNCWIQVSFDLFQLLLKVAKKTTAIIGTTGILKSIKKYAPTVKRVVVTSSFAAINDVFAKAADKIYSEVCRNLCKLPSNH